MLKIIKILLAFLLIFSRNEKLCAQSFDVKWGEKASIISSFEDAIEVEIGKYIVLKVENFKGSKDKLRETKASLLLIDDEGRIILEKEIGNDELNTTFIGFKKTSKNLLLFYQVFDKDSKTTNLYVGKIDQKLLVVEEVKKMGTYPAFHLYKQAVIETKPSNDGSKLLVFVNIPDGSFPTKKFYLYVFDRDFNKIWDQEVNLPYKEHYVVLEDYCISNKGKVYLSFRSSYKGYNLRNKIKKPTYYLSVLTFSSDTSVKEKEIVLNFGKSYLRGSYMILTNNDELLKVAGLCEPLKKGEDVYQDGIFYAFIETNTGTITAKDVVRFDEDLIKLVSKDGFASSKKKNFGIDPYYNAKGLVVRQNGSIDLICDFVRDNSATVLTGKNFDEVEYFTDNWICGTLVNINISEDGKVLFTRIPKILSHIDYRHLSIQDRFSPKVYGAYPLVQKDELIYFYNDSKENIAKDLSMGADEVKDFDKTALVTAVIGVDGNLVRKFVLGNDFDSYCTMPTKFIKLNENTIFLQSSQLKDGKYKPRFGIMKLK